MSVDRPFALSLAAAAAVSLAALAPAHAGAFEVEGAPITTPRGNLFIPCLKVALVPQPDPPGLEQRMGPDAAGRPAISASNPAGARYSLIVSGQDDVTGAWLRVFPQQSCTPTSCADGVNFVVLAPDGSPVTLRVAITGDDGRLDPATVRGFNPQPEPPLNRPTPGQIDFGLTSTLPSTVATATLRLTQGDREIPLD